MRSNGGSRYGSVLGCEKGLAAELSVIGVVLVSGLRAAWTPGLTAVQVARMANIVNDWARIGAFIALSNALIFPYGRSWMRSVPALTAGLRYTFHGTPSHSSEDSRLEHQ